MLKINIKKIVATMYNVWKNILPKNADVLAWLNEFIQFVHNVYYNFKA